MSERLWSFWRWNDPHKLVWPLQAYEDAGATGDMEDGGTLAPLENWNPQWTVIPVMVDID